MTMARPAYAITTSSPGSELAGETAAAMAAASILFNTSDPGTNFNLIYVLVYPSSTLRPIIGTTV